MNASTLTSLRARQLAFVLASGLALAGCDQHPIASTVLVITPDAKSLHLVGRFDAADNALVCDAGTIGYLHYGPYAALPAGPYEATFKTSIEASAGTKVVLDVNASTTDKPNNPVAATTLTADGRDQSSSLLFTAVAGARHEFRVMCDGKATVKLYKITITKR